MWTQTNTEQIKKFITYHEADFLVSTEDESSKPISTSPTPHPSAKISRDELIPHILEVLHKHGGKAKKKEVEQELFQKFREITITPWYQELVSCGIPQWQHHLAWAKEMAKKKGLIKKPEESGRGYWEVTKN